MAVIGQLADRIVRPTKPVRELNLGRRLIVCFWLGLACAGCDSGGGEADLAESGPLVKVAPRAAQGEVRFVQGYEAGCEQARNLGKPMLVFFTAGWCNYCHQMAAEAFVQPGVVGLSDRFVCVLIDADREPEVCRQFQVKYYPTVQFLSPQAAPLNRLTGKKSAEQLLTEMHAALQAVARRQVGSRF